MGSALSVIRGNVRNNLSEPTTENYTNAELNQYIGEAYKHYFELMKYNGEGYFETTTYISIIAGQSDYSVAALTPPFSLISQVEKVNPAGFVGTTPLREDERRFRPNLLNFANSGTLYYPTYKMRGMNIVFEPTPQFSETNSILLSYVYEPTFPTSTSLDSFTFDSNFAVSNEPLIELYATIRALEAKDGIGGVSDINSFRVTLEKFEKTFIENLNRFEEPDRISYAGSSYSRGGYY